SVAFQVFYRLILLISKHNPTTSITRMENRFSFSVKALQNPYTVFWTRARWLLPSQDCYYHLLFQYNWEPSQLEKHCSEFHQQGALQYLTKEVSLFVQGKPIKK